VAERAEVLGGAGLGEATGVEAMGGHGGDDRASSGARRRVRASWPKDGTELAHLARHSREFSP
jgi:hypothetical protein